MGRSLHSFWIEKVACVCDRQLITSGSQVFDSPFGNNGEGRLAPWVLRVGLSQVSSVLRVHAVT